MKIGRGRPTENSKYRQVAQVSYSSEYTIEAEVIKKYEVQDSIFPLVINTDWKAKQILKIYKDQPYFLTNTNV